MRRLQTSSEKNSFVSQIEKRLEVNNIMEFPSLSNLSISAKNEEENTKELYINASLKENTQEKREKYLSGWMYIRMNKEDRKIKKMMNGKLCDSVNVCEEQQDIDSLNKTEYNKKAIKIISEMTQNWENYKTWYINLYGIDCYQKMYEMGHKDDNESYEDYDEYDEDYISSQENNYYSSDQDDYDY